MNKHIRLQRRTPYELEGHHDMLFTMRCMYRDGTILSSEEIRKGICRAGNLIVEKYVCAGKDVRKARLLSTMTILFARDLVPPLFDIEIATMDDQQMGPRSYNDLLDVSVFKKQRYKQSWILQHPPTWVGYRG
ncbi:hypothetical protein [Noviherbaspirillum soli]|uniref:hypothetical protein n=1 Tax=Noviherbaspirillum soli TaxID=1064518 RepID=UPI00188AF7BB|nr:hypothetical protein [Noviherbaspirillum soli]